MKVQGGDKSVSYFIGRHGYEHTHSHTHLEVLLEHGQFELLGALRILGIHRDLLAHHVSREHADAVLALGADWLPILEELLSQLVHLRVEDESKGQRWRVFRRKRNEEGSKESRGGRAKEGRNRKACLRQIRPLL